MTHSLEAAIEELGKNIDWILESRDELLNALKRLVEVLNDDLDPAQCEAWDAARAAIANAEGGTARERETVRV